MGYDTILLIEDNFDNAECTRLLLEMNGYKVIVAEGGLSGVQIARQIQPRVVICDISMPNMNGYLVAKILKNEPRLLSTPLIAISAYFLKNNDELQKAYQAGFSECLAKPFNPDDLVKMVERLITPLPSVTG